MMSLAPFRKMRPLLTVSVPPSMQRMPSLYSLVDLPSVAVVLPALFVIQILSLVSLAFQTMEPAGSASRSMLVFEMVVVPPVRTIVPFPSSLTAPSSLTNVVSPVGSMLIVVFVGV